MTITDSPDVRKLLENLLPGLHIDSVPAKSGQRVVYFCKFLSPASSRFQNWGDVVLKVSQQLSPKQIAYLQKEVEILNSLDSPCYPKLLHTEVFTHDPRTEDPLPARLFVSVEKRINASPLSDCVRDFQTEQSVANLLIRLIDALDLLWSRPDKIIHRDLKPANILVKKDRGIVIIDLGIVREEGTAGNTETVLPWGPCSPPYASPEQAKNDKRHITFKSDFFAMGTIAYELLCGRNPYYATGDCREDILHKVLTKAPPTLASLGRASEAFSGVIETVMRKEPYERYRSPQRFRDALLLARGALNG